LDAFLAACKNNPSGGCKIDAIAVHFYVCQVDWLKPKVELFYKYNLPIWLTEFSAGDCSGQTPQSQAAFMTDAVNYLDANPKIARYAWFSGRNTNVQASSLLAAGKGVKVNPTGSTYNSLGLPTSCASGAANANTATDISETDPTVTSPSSTTTSPDNGMVPGWATFGLVIASVGIVVLVLVLVILMRKREVEGRVERP